MTVSILRPLKRQSCDRCHTQKLRCARHGNGHGDMCIRCVRQGTECVYSAPLPKGRRPSSQVKGLSRGTALGKDWTTGGTEGKKGSGLIDGTQSQDLAQASTKTINPNTTEINSKDTEKVNTITDTKDFGLESYSKPTKKEYEHDHEHGFTGLATPSTSTWEENDFSTEFSPSPDAVDHEMGGNETWPWESDHYWPDWVGADASMMSNQDLLPNAGRVLPVLTPLRTFQENTPEIHVDMGTDGGRQSAISTSSSASFGNSIPIPNQNLHFNHHEKINHNLETPSMTPTLCQTAGPDTSAIDTQSCIAQLSELLSRLSATFITAQQDTLQSKAPKPSFLNVAFESAASILSSPEDQESSTRNSVSDTFNASQRLLEILQQLQDIQTCSTPTSPENTNAQNPFAPHPLDTLPLSHISKLVSSSSQPPPSQSIHHSVLHHLILACHSLLLNMYKPFLTTLQNSISINNYTPNNGSSSSSGSWTTGSIGMDLKMVMLVQCVSFLIERLGNAVGAYLGTGTGSGMGVEVEILGKVLRLKQSLRM